MKHKQFLVATAASLFFAGAAIAHGDEDHAAKRPTLEFADVLCRARFALSSGRAFPSPDPSLRRASSHGSLSAARGGLDLELDVDTRAEAMVAKERRLRTEGNRLLHEGRVTTRSTVTSRC